MCLICNDKRITEGSIRRCEMDCSKDHLIERGKYYEQSVL